MFPQALAFALWLAPALAAAQAQPLVAEGRQLLDEGRFEDAIERFTAAEAADDLTREDLVLLLEGRALAAHALRDLEAMNRELARLLKIAPEHRFDPTLPPDLETTFASLRASAGPPIAIATSSRRRGDMVVIETTVTGDGDGLGRSVRIAARLPGRAWETGGERVEIAASPSETVEYFAELLGPGGAVIAASGTADRPEQRPPDAASGETPIPVGPDDDGGLSPWIWVAIGGGAALVAAGVITLVLVLSAEPGTQPGYPFLR